MEKTLHASQNLGFWLCPGRHHLQGLWLVRWQAETLDHLHQHKACFWDIGGWTQAFSANILIIISHPWNISVTHSRLGPCSVRGPDVIEISSYSSKAVRNKGVGVFLSSSSKLPTVILGIEDGWPIQRHGKTSKQKPEHMELIRSCRATYLEVKSHVWILRRALLAQAHRLHRTLWTSSWQLHWLWVPRNAESFRRARWCPVWAKDRQSSHLSRYHAQHDAKEHHQRLPIETLNLEKPRFWN